MQRVWKLGTGSVGTLGNALRSPSGYVVLVCLLMMGGFSWGAWTDRAAKLDAARTETDNLARAVADHAVATLRTADIVVAGVAERVGTAAEDPAALRRLHGLLARNATLWSSVQDVMAFRSDGSWIVGSSDRGPGPPPDGEAFAYHRTHPGHEVRIGRPVYGWAAPGWALPVSRRLDGPDGAFAGVVFATIDTTVFRDFYRTFKIGPRTSIAMVDDRGWLIARARGADGLVGQDVWAADFFQNYRRIGPIGNSRHISPLDGVTRENSFRHTDLYPFVAFVGFSRADVIDAWWAETRRDGAVVLVLVLCTGLLGARLSVQMRKHQVAERTVRESEQLYRLLAVNSTDVIIRIDRNFKRIYVSPSSFDVLGRRPEELIGRTPERDIHPEDWPKIAEELEAMRWTDGARQISGRFRLPDGSYRPVEMNIRRLEQDEGYVVSMRNVSARVEMAAKLHEANNRLHRLVMLDGLTGIANRRCFDKFFEKEFRRGARTATPCSLLMIDADRFKLFNDTYGHQAGDECLKAIAGVLGAHMRRAADLAARYGGEEFVVLLPETDEPGALDIAERIRAAVSGLTILHGGSDFGVVTISIGVASAIPGHQAETAADLLSAADGALYEAKAGGRNRVARAGWCVEVPVVRLAEPV